jgi:hypothetical protein
MKALLLLLVHLSIYTLQTQVKPDVILTQSDKDLIPEGIAVERKTGTIYISSIARHTIIPINKKELAAGFISKKDQHLVYQPASRF